MDDKFNLFGICNEIHILLLWVFLSIAWYGIIVSTTRLKNLEEKIEKTLDNDRYYVIIEYTKH